MSTYLFGKRAARVNDADFAASLAKAHASKTGAGEQWNSKPYMDAPMPNAQFMTARR